MWFYSVCANAAVRQHVFEPCGLIYPKFILTTSSVNSKSQQMALCYNKTLPHCLLPSPQLYRFRGDLNLFVLAHNLTFFLLPCFFHCNHTFQLGGSKEEQSQKEIAKLYVAFIFICVAPFWNPLPPCAPEARIILTSALALYKTGLIRTARLSCYAIVCSFLEPDAQAIINSVLKYL